MTANIVNRIELPALVGRDAGEAALGERLDLVGHVPVRLNVALGTAELTIDRLFSLSASDVIELDSEVDAPVDVRLDGKVIARGTLVAIGDNFGVRITEISLEP
jgi:flagellar motor switch protein FliN